MSTDGDLALRPDQAARQGLFPGVLLEKEDPLVVLSNAWKPYLWERCEDGVEDLQVRINPSEKYSLPSQNCWTVLDRNFLLSSLDCLREPFFENIQFPFFTSVLTT